MSLVLKRPLWGNEYKDYTSITGYPHGAGEGEPAAEDEYGPSQFGGG